MLIKSKSLIAAVGLALVALLTFAVGARILGTKEKTSFAEDGYILSASAQDGQENVTVSDQLWFSAGTVWTSSGETIAFTGSEGSAIETAADSFIHYEGSSIASVTDTSVMNLDEFTEGVIQYYGMEQGETLSRTTDGSYYLGDDTEESFENFLIKSSDTRYILGSSIITLMRSAGSGDSIDSGFAEVEYLSDDKSIVLINDGVNAWQFLSEGAWLQLANGVCFDLASGELYVSADVTELTSGELSSSGALAEALLSISVDDIEIDAEAANASSWTSSGYPVYRFTVINGLDGADGEDGASGADGADGEDGEQGEDGQTGESDVSGEEGATGTTGTTGGAGLNGASGGLVSGVAMATSVPTITVSSWVVDGQVLSFELTMDEVSCDSIEEGTTVITLIDLDTGEVVRVWTSDSDYDSDYYYYYELADVLDSTNDNDALAYNGLEAGHQYEVSVYAEYILEGLDEPVGQVLLTRTFTADDYGISFDLIDRTEDSFTFTLNTGNRLVTVQEVEVYVDGVYYGTYSDFDEIDIDLNNLSGSTERDYSNQSFTITFQPTFVVTTYTLDENNETVMTTTTMSDVTYEYTYTTLKHTPTLGGVSLTAYNSGYFLAQALGEYDDVASAYTSPDDPDDTITSIRFELYKSAAGMASADSSTLVASQTVTSGYITYFSVSSDEDDAIHTGDYYWLRAYYIYNDGEKEVELPIYESNSNKLGTFYSIDQTSENDTSFTAAWDGARLLTITNVSLTFTGDTNIKNTTDDTEDNNGITFNSIEGVLTAAIGASNGYVLNEDYPMELQISAEPDYYVSTEYTAVSNTYLYTASAGVTNEADGTTGSIAAVTVLNIPLDLTGLKADTTYMFTLYGYDSNYNRVTIGSVSLKTASERTVKIALFDYVTDDGIGVWFRLGEYGATNYYYNDSSYWNTSLKEEYLKNTDASYRSLYSLTFELYRADDSSTMLGSVTIYDETTTPEVGRNTLYEKFYGVAGSNTMQSYAKQGYEGIVGVGSDYVYRFVNSAGVELQENSLTNGSYYITVTAAYDYTEYRYDYMDYNSDSGVYDYYAWTSAKSAYVNSLPLSGTVKFTGLELVAAPYLEPDEIVSSDGSYITVTELLNSETGEFNGDDSDNSVYSLFWDDDTTAGVKLTTNYVGDTTYPTQTFTYYGFSYDVWNSLSSSSTPTQETDETGEPLYDIKITITLNAPGTESARTTVPEVYLLFYNEDDLPYIANITEATPADSNYEGADFVYDTTGNEDGILVLYMNEEYFYRGQSYVFVLEAELTEDYTYTGQTDNEAFQYPETYYELQGEDYTKSNTLSSNVISIYRQEPVVYSQLVSTTGGEQDVWSIYVNDPDDAIQWKSILDTYNSTSPVSQASDRGGITNLFGEKLGANSDGKYLTFDFVSATDSSDVVAMDELYEYYDTSSEEAAPSYYLVDEDLEDIRDAVTYLYFDRDDKEVTKRGTTVNVWNLDPEGGSYRLSADYILLDDVGYNAATSYTNISLLEHNYISVMSAEEADQLDVSDVQPDEDNNTIYVYLSAAENDLTEWGADLTAGETLSVTSDYYLSSDYLNKARQIAAVKLTVEVTHDGVTSYIKDRNSEGTIVDAYKELWLYPIAPSNGASDYRYYLKFKITDLDSASDDTLQYAIGDELSFHLEVYYLTGDSGLDDTGLDNDNNPVLTSDYYAVKYVNAIENTNLYGTTTRYYSERYLYTSSRTVNRTYAGAGRSLFYVGASYVNGSTLPWQQTITLSSDTFDTALGANGRTLSYYLTNLDGYSATDVLEIMEVASYAQTDIGATEVASAVPSLNSTTTTGGLTTVNISATLENWNLVETNASEDVVHLYYLLYSYDTTSGTAKKTALVGAWIGSEKDLDTSDGTISVDLTGLDNNTSYYIEVFYKDADNAGSSGWTDSDLFSAYRAGQLYEVSAAEAIAKVIWGGTDYLTGTLSDTNLFQYVVNGKRIFGATSEGVTLSSVSLSLGNSYTSFTTEKTLKATATISSEILSAEQSSLYVCYKLERRLESSTSDDDWTVVATDTQMAASGDPEWNSGATTKYPTNTTKGENTLSWTYEAGNGVIEPGYSYRVTADVYQLQSGGSYESVSKKEDGQSSGAVTSDAVTWSSVSLSDDEQALIQTANITYSDTTISLSYRMNDVNYTSPDNVYYVYLAQKSGDSYTLLNNTTTDSTLYSAPTIGTAHQMGSTYSGSFQKLSASTTYRLQFYAVLDLNYDGTDDVGIGTDTIKVGDQTLVLAGYSDDITTREAGVSSGAGDYSRTIVGGSTLLTLRFSNAFSAGGITRVDYMLAQADGSVYDMVTLTKASGATSMFDATAGSGAGDGTDGTIYLTLDLAADETSTANVSTAGKYYLTVQMYTTNDEGEYVKSTGYSITFYNSTNF